MKGWEEERKGGKEGREGGDREGGVRNEEEKERN